MTMPPIRAWILVILTSFCLLSVSYFTLGRIGLFIGLILALFWNYAMLLHRHYDAKTEFKANRIQGRDPWGLRDSLNFYQQKFRSLPTELYLCQNQHPLFLVCTSNWNEPYILISTGLLDLMSQTELESLMALGITTTRARCSFLRYTLNRMALSWIALGSLLDQLLPYRDLKIALHIHYLVAWLHLKLAYPRSLQAKADLEAYQNLERPRDLATALWKIHGFLNNLPMSMPKVLRHQSVIGPSESRRSAFHFILPIELRLQFLVGYFPI